MVKIDCRQLPGSRGTNRQVRSGRRDDLGFASPMAVRYPHVDRSDVLASRAHETSTSLDPQDGAVVQRREVKELFSPSMLKMNRRRADAIDAGMSGRSMSMSTDGIVS